jgi:GAF domain-containing protein
LAAEVGRKVSQVRDLGVMLRDACELIRKEFDLYYVQVYLTNPSQTALQLQTGTGEVGAQLVGRGHSLPLNTSSINGRAAMEKRSVVISDTAQSATFRQNPLLPETRGEMAVPLIVADKVVGVLDMQSSEPGVLNPEVLPAFEALAGQLAVAIQNANLLAETEQAHAQVEKQARRLVREGWNEHLDAIHKPEKLGFVFDHNKVAPLAEMDETQLPEDGNTISVPIAVTGEPLGSIVVEIDDETRREQTNELVSVVARQVAQQIENLRLLESAERYRLEAEEAARRQTLEGWQELFRGKQNQALRFLYDSNQVKPVSAQAAPEAHSSLSVPIKVRDETMGTITILGMEHDDPSAVELVGEITQRLGTHLENLRLSEQTRERAQREQALRKITSIVRGSTNAESILRSAARELGSLLGRKTIVRLSPAEAQSAPGNGREQGAPENQSRES